MEGQFAEISKLSSRFFFINMPINIWHPILVTVIGAENGFGRSGSIIDRLFNDSAMGKSISSCYRLNSRTSWVFLYRSGI